MRINHSREGWIYKNVRTKVKTTDRDLSHMWYRSGDKVRCYYNGKYRFTFE